MNGIYDNLQVLTHQESGAVAWDNGEIWIGNWTNIAGLPRVLESVGDIGLGEQITAIRCATPATTKRAMQQHERDNGAQVVRQTGWRSWRVNNQAIVTINSNWN